MVTYRNWNGRNVDLVLLAEHVRSFLKERGFNCKERCVRGDLGKGKEFTFEFSCGRFNVNISGFPDNFTVDFNVVPPRLSLVASGFNFLGGGAFVWYDSKAREFLDLVEKDFWVFVENVVARLENSGCKC
jgi:hypothetical protein